VEFYENKCEAGLKDEVASKDWQLQAYYFTAIKRKDMGCLPAQLLSFKILDFRSTPVNDKL